MYLLGYNNPCLANDQEKKCHHVVLKVHHPLRVNKGMVILCSKLPELSRRIGSWNLLFPHITAKWFAELIPIIMVGLMVSAYELSLESVLHIHDTINARWPIPREVL